MSVNYTSHVQDATTVELAIKTVLLACLLKIIITVVLQLQHNS